MMLRIPAALVAAVCVLTGCSPVMNATVQTLREAVIGPRDAAEAQLNPAFRYLRVTVDGRVTFLALGSVDQHPHGPVEVWVSGQREVLRLQNGRLAGASGVTTEWRAVTLPELPSWTAIARAAQPLQWVRVRDVMPGYRFGVRDELVLSAISPPQKSALQRVDAQSLSWFEERFRSGRVAGRWTRLVGSTPADAALPPARYAVDLRNGDGVVVYGEQCLAPELCFTWQRWK